jgi:hypothetical protein
MSPGLGTQSTPRHGDVGAGGRCVSDRRRGRRRDRRPRRPWSAWPERHAVWLTARATTRARPATPSPGPTPPAPNPARGNRSVTQSPNEPGSPANCPWPTPPSTHAARSRGSPAFPSPSTRTSPAIRWAYSSTRSASKARMASRLSPSIAASLFSLYRVPYRPAGRWALTGRCSAAPVPRGSNTSTRPCSSARAFSRSGAVSVPSGRAATVIGPASSSAPSGATTIIGTAMSGSLNV